MADTKKPEGLVYKGHPLRRVDNFIYYGSMADEYIVMLQILETKKEKDMDVASRVSVQLQLTAPDLKALGIIDGIIPEPSGGAQADPARMIQNLDRALTQHLTALSKESGAALVRQRYEKFRAMGGGKEAP